MLYVNIAVVRQYRVSRGRVQHSKVVVEEREGGGVEDIEAVLHSFFLLNPEWKLLGVTAAITEDE